MAPILAAMYGPRESVTLYPMGLVLREIKADIDEARLSEWTQHEYGLMMEQEAKARQRSRKR